MNIFNKHLLITLLAASASLTAYAAETLADCIVIMEGSSPVCIRGLTQSACNERALGSNGKATWQEGQSCPGAEGDRGACMIEISGMTPSCIGGLTDKECTERASSHVAKGNWQQGKECPTPKNIQYDPSNGALILIN